MELPNLMAAWRVLVHDNVPAQIRPSADAVFPQALAEVQKTLSPEEVNQAEAALAEIRQPEDEHDLNSPLWTVCSGDPSEVESAQHALTGPHGSTLNSVLEELFEATGYAVEWSR